MFDNVQDPSFWGMAVAALIFGVVKAITWLVQKKIIDLDFGADRSEGDRLARVERMLEDLIRQGSIGNPRAPRLSASERKLRDRAIKALAKDRIDTDDIARVIGCTERVARRVLGET